MLNNKPLPFVFFIFFTLVLILGTNSAVADDDKKNKKNKNLVITEILVTFDDAANAGDDTLLITLAGTNLDKARAVSVFLGEQGGLDVLSFGGNQVLARCPAPDFRCADGDYLLSVSVQLARGRGHDNGKKKLLKTAAYVV